MPPTAAPLSLQRALLVAAAGVVVVLAVVWLRGTHAETRLLGLAYAPSTATVRAGAPQVPGLVDRAGELNGDTRARVYEAVIDYRLGRNVQARALLRSVVREQPAAVDAWGILALVEDRLDPRAAAQVRARIRALNPLVAERRSP